MFQMKRKYLSSFPSFFSGIVNNIIIRNNQKTACSCEEWVSECATDHVPEWWRSLVFFTYLALNKRTSRVQKKKHKIIAIVKSLCQFWRSIFELVIATFTLSFLFPATFSMTVFLGSFIYFLIHSQIKNDYSDKQNVLWHWNFMWLRI